jgi:uncharacterized protein YecE (DUF72 family)
MSTAPDSHRILVGTSGYSFPGWVGPFYPPGLKSSEFLTYYARHFDVVEVNTTYYGIPKPQVMEQMVKKTPAHFGFVAKLHKTMTHELDEKPETYAEFLAAIEPLKQAGRYDGLLAQFPWGFRRTDLHRRHLAAIRRLLPDEPLFVEFRHDSWLTPALEPSLRQEKIGFCAVDEPQLEHMMPPVTMVTSEDAYVRFHGRNAEHWYGAGRDLRYDYDYPESELREWIQKIGELAQQARRTYLFFNNCHAGQAARNAQLMKELLKQEGLPV